MKPTILILAALALCSCDNYKGSDQKQQEQQENILDELTMKTGMPAIKNGRERKILKDIIELRDQEGLTTYTYIVAEMTGKLVFLGESIGYGIPAATQYTNPEKLQRITIGGTAHYEKMPQADPNGLFSPYSAEGTWVLMKDPNGDKVVPLYVEPRIIVSPFKLNTP